MVIRLPNIKNISSLRQYTAVLDEVGKGKPVFLMREGKGRYAIVDMEEYDSMRGALWGKLFQELDEAQQMGEEQGWVSLEAAKKQLKAHD